MRLGGFSYLWFGTIAFPLLLGTSASDPARNTCSFACRDLRRQVGERRVTKTPKDPYWAQQINEIQPACYVRPSSVSDIAKIINIAKSHECPFAIRGAGHSDVPGASNLEDGITLDLGGLRKVTLAKDKSKVTIGAGSNWGDVYTSLDPHGVTVVGGRESSVGVAGLTLGGGVSYFSGEHGFACDNVASYSVVLANGSFIRASPSSLYASLHRALRGGGNNFGVITDFTLYTIPYGGSLTGGLVTYRDSSLSQNTQLSAFTRFAHSNPKDPSASIFTSVNYASGAFFWASGLYHTTPYDPLQTHPKVFRPFYTAAANLTRLASTVRVTSHANLAQELGMTQPNGFREQFHTATFAANLTLANRIARIFREEVTRAAGLGIANVTASLALQPLTKNLLKAQTARGAGINVLGLSEEEAPLMLMSTVWPWLSAAQDGAITGAMGRVMSRSIRVAKEMGLWNKFVYMNYARPGKDVISTYGKDNVNFLKEMSKRYDEEGVFQSLVPGGFKLPGNY